MLLNSIVVRVCVVLLGMPQICSATTPQRFEAAESHMGTMFRVVLYADNEDVANRALRAAFTRIRELDERLSDYNSESELSRLSSGSPHPQWVAISDDLWRVLATAQSISEKSEGAFDVTVGPMTKLWRRSRRVRELPSQVQLNEVLRSVGFRHILLDTGDRRARLLRPQMRLDLGGIAQGFAADEALACMRNLGIESALVNASGDIAVGKSPPGESGWLVAIGELKPNVPPSRFVRLANCAISTSGDLFQHVEIGGVRYSHIVDPKTGLGLSDRSSATVIASNCTLADSLATALCVLGKEQGLRLVSSIPQTVALILRQNEAGGIESAESPDFKKYCVMP